MEEEVKKQEEKEVKKMSYEELENTAHQLSEQLRQAYIQLRQNNMVQVFKRLDYLFKVIEFENKFPKEFTSKCLIEIQELITIPDKEETKETKSE